MNLLSVLNHVKPRNWFPLGFSLFITVISATSLLAQSEINAGLQVSNAESRSKPEQSGIKKILLIGNSFTFWRGGLDKHLKILSKAMSPPLGYQTKAITRGGASLEVMWKKTSAVDEIKEGKYDIVILQGDIPETTVDSFRNYSKKFVDLVRETGARPIVFMTWHYDRLNWISMHEIADAHLEVSRKMEVQVAPVGTAWTLSNKRRPDLDMYDKDAEHPSVAGMYLSLLIIESTISGESPLTRSPKKMKIPGLKKLDNRTKRELQKVAQDALKLWKQR